MKIYFYLTCFIVLLGAGWYLAPSSTVGDSQNTKQSKIKNISTVAPSLNGTNSTEIMLSDGCLIDKERLHPYQLRSDLLTWFKVNGYQDLEQNVIDRFMLSIGYPLDFSRIVGSTLRTGFSFENNLMSGSKYDFITMSSLNYIYSSLSDSGVSVLSNFENYAFDFQFITGGRMKPTLFFGPMYFSMVEGFSLDDYFSHDLKASELDLYHLIRQGKFYKIEPSTLVDVDSSGVFENAFFMHSYLTLSIYYGDLKASLYFARNFPVFEPDNQNKVINKLAEEIKGLPDWVEVYEILENHINSQERLNYDDSDMVFLSKMKNKYHSDLVGYYSKYFTGCSSKEVNRYLVNIMSTFDKSQFGFSSDFDYWRGVRDELARYLDLMGNQNSDVEERMLIAFGEDDSAEVTELSKEQVSLISESSKLIYQGDYEDSFTALVAAIGDNEASRSLVLNQAILLGKESGDIRKILDKGASFNMGSFYASFSHGRSYMNELKREGLDVMSFSGIPDAVKYIYKNGEKEAFMFLVSEGIFTSDSTSSINFLDLALDSVFVSHENLFFLTVMKAEGVIDVNYFNQDKLERIKRLDPKLYDQVYNVMFN